MSKNERFFCKGCPGNEGQNPAFSLSEVSGSDLNRDLRHLRRGKDRPTQQIGAAVCELLESDSCEGPVKVPAVRYDNEGEYTLPHTKDLVCGRGRDMIAQLAHVVESAAVIDTIS